MKLEALKSCPPVSAEQNSTLAFYVARQELCLVYEAERDFLSTPRAFVVVRAQLDSDAELHLNHTTLSEPEAAFLASNAYGVYCNTLSEAPFKHLFFYSPKMTLECIAIGLQPITTLYHHNDVRSALKHAMG